MSSLAGCSSSRSSSFRSSARYSCSSVNSIQTEAASSPPDPLFMPFLREQRATRFGAHEGDADSFGGCQGDRKSNSEGYHGDWSHGDAHGVIWVDGGYYTSVNVSRFAPHDIVVMAFNSSIVIHAEKLGEDGGVIDRFTHKSLLPEDMDPLSVSGTLMPDGVLVISVKSLSTSLSRP
ncbi:hypothetical protein HF521_002629 [Silurus meridionalis]|uniref:SHSP domain-containing protein n=2 Tax=Silurus meridionalis TaxID=175797 RepID=A0A8T0B1Z0_SILME|nr:hypothetical protein HF521_002629 [Silurus meridionalis]